MRTLGLWLLCFAACNSQEHAPDAAVAVEAEAPTTTVVFARDGGSAGSGAAVAQSNPVANEPSATNTATSAATSTGVRAAAGHGAESPEATIDSDDASIATGPADDECIYHELRAHQGAGAYPLPKDAADRSVCFAFDLGSEAPMQALSFKPLIDNRKILHHFIVYRWDALDPSKPIQDCDSIGADALIIGGWAPGAGDWTLPRDVGVDLGPGRIVLEVHYTNYTEADQTDQSGMQLCATHNLRPTTASVSWLGSHLFLIPAHATNYQVASRCTPTTNKTIHVIRVWPHMHTLGRRMTMELTRANGGRSVVFDQPFSFESQKQYDLPLVMEPGDSLLTTCYFDNSTDQLVTVGTKASDEMCHNFVLAWPADALSGTGDFADSCLGLP